MTSSSNNIARRLLKPLAFVALAGIVGAATAVGALAHGGGATGWQHGAMAADASPADMAEHVERMLQHVYIEIGATDAQKAQLEPILTKAVADLMPLRGQFHDGHAQLLALLGQDNVDRNAIEALRTQHVQMADQASRTLTKALGDVADVLTPAQRKTLLARIAEHHAAGPG